MNRLLKRTLVTALSGFVMISLAQADDDEKHESTSGKKLDAKSFVEKATYGNTAEIKMAEIGMRKAQNQEVKQYAAQLHRDHLQASNRLDTVAKDVGVTEHSELKEKHEQALKKLENASNFDREFVLASLKHHVRDVGFYEKAQAQVDDQNVKQYVQETLPTLRQHLNQAKTVAQTIGVDQATIASVVSQAEQPMGGSEDVEDEGHQRDQGADSKVHKGAGAEQLTEGTKENK